jgi:anti-sigma B factor antagonist
VEPGLPLSISEIARDGELRLAVTGELDLASAPSLLTHVEQLEIGGAGTLAIDLAGVTFMDVAGMRVLLEAARRAHSRETRFVIYNPRRIASRVFALTAVDQQLKIAFDDPADA